MSAPETIKAQSPAIEKKHDKPSLVELKNGKVYFKQKPLSLEKQSETLQEIVQFRDMLEGRIKNSEPPLTTFPDEHKSLIAKLAHESDKTLAALTKHIHHGLLPTIDDDEDPNIASTINTALPVNTVERAIEEVLIRKNYGVDAPSGVRVHAGLCIWRWEVRSKHMSWLPRNSREKAEIRQQERLQAKEDLKALFEALSQEERDVLIDPRGATKLPAKELNKPPIASTSSDAKGEDSKGTAQSSKKQGKKKAEEPENDNQTEMKTPRPKKAQDPEKTAKEKERMEKKAARLEKEKKEKEAKNKSQSIMAKFFVKPTKPSRPSDVQQSAVAGPSRIQSDFQKTFKPFVLHKDKTLAPTNWFRGDKKRKRRAGLHSPNKNAIIVIDSDEDCSDVEMVEPKLSESTLKSMSSQDRLKDILSSMPAPAPSSRPRSLRQVKREKGFKVFHPISVRDLMTQLSEAEISGNDDVVRNILAKLSDRELLPVKAFCFDTDARPGYFGTWMRSSRIIGPRTPFAKDTLVFDYAYDSGEEWEDEPAGEDVVDNGEEEEADADEQDSDLESWLVDDDEQPDLELLSRSSPPPLFDFSNTSPPKRKADDPENKIGKKRKVVVPLVPFAKGPMFEAVIGQCEYDPFKPYAIQLMNDTPQSIDPFTFVSTCIEDYNSSSQAVKSNPNNTGTATNDPVFILPALPPRLISSKASNSTLDPSTNTPNTLKKASAGPKASFPDAYLNVLLTKITQLQAPSISSLVESIYLDLREHKVKKGAIEAKVREVGEKCKEKKFWIVKPALQTATPFLRQ